ncbi:MAG TPA: YihY/virulence factor BrkB family protein [Rubricoccaceae bacterium]|nr:YihY/virulence factor BrkB family protein [Rubricoccaceae bacterium]
MRPFPPVLPLLKTTVKEVGDDDLPSLAAAIAYYTIFSLPALLAVALGVAGAVFGAEAVREMLLAEVGGLVGAEGAGAIQGMIESASDLGDSLAAKVGGVAVLLVGASGAFGQFQKALNRVWEIEPAPVQGGRLAFVKQLLLKRVLSFGMVATIGFLLLVSLVMSTALSVAGETLGGVSPGGVIATLLRVVHLVVSLGVVTVLFAAMFVLLPDRRIPWRDVWVGAAVTAALFTLGKFLIGLYIGTSDPGSAFGVAGSLALMLIWIYYSALIVLAGAEFTQAYTTWRKETEERHPWAQPRDPQPY